MINKTKAALQSCQCDYQIINHGQNTRVNAGGQRMSRLNIEYELLPYHRMGQPKYGYLGRRYDFAGKQLDREKMKRLIELAR